MLKKQLHILENGIITPTVYDPKTDVFTGGVYSQHGTLCQPAERSHLLSNVRFFPPSTIDPQIPCDEELSGTTLYLGHYTHFYGHFLMETLARFWALDSDLKYDHIVFHTLFDNASTSDTFSAAQTAFEAFGINPIQVKIIKKTVKAEKLIVPTKLIAVSDQASPEQAAIYQKLIAHCHNQNSAGPETLPKRVYVSRRQLNSLGNRERFTQNEAEAEAVFESHGFTVVYPEQLDFQYQVRLFHAADIVAGLDGSALHNALFMRPGTKTIILGNPRKPNAPHLNQLICNRLAQVEPIFIPYRGNLLDEQSGAFEINIQHLTEQLQERLNSPASLPESANPDPHVVAILGMHRSGTSSLSGSLNKAGLFAGEISRSSQFQHKGNWENEILVVLNDRALRANGATWHQPPEGPIRWDDALATARQRSIADISRQTAVWMFKDPRTLLTLPFWQDGIRNLHTVAIFRHPMSVALSLYRREQMPIRQGLDLWISYNQRLLAAHAERPFPILCFDLEPDAYVQQLETVIEQLNRQLDGITTLSAERAVQFFAKDGMHFRNIVPLLADDASEADKKQIETIQQIYAQLLTAANQQAPSPEKTIHIPLENSVYAFRQALESDPNSPILHEMLGHALTGAGEQAAAVHSFETALSLKPDQTDLQLKLASLYKDLGHLQQAAAIYESMLPSRRQDIHFMVQLIQLYRRQKRFDKVIELCNQGLAQHPPLQQQHHLTTLAADATRQLGDQQGAKALFEQAIAIDPQNVPAYVSLANMLVQMGELEQATVLCNRALGQGPNHAACHQCLGDIQRMSNQNEAAVDSYKRALACGAENMWVSAHLAHVFNQLQRFAESRTVLQQLLASGTHHPDLYRILADSYRLDGDDETAVTHYKQALALNPTHAGVLINLGWTLIRLKAFEQAAPFVWRASKLRPENVHIQRAVEQLKQQQITFSKTVSICAIIAVRNETHYLRYLLPHLAQQNIDVVLIDNESAADSHAFYEPYMGNPIIKIESIQRKAFFSLSDVLKRKQEISQTIDYDWVIHHDADEILQHHEANKTLRDAIQEANDTGYNMLNFEEFTFIPEPGADYFGTDYRKGLLRYYFFEPRKNRLNRAWKRTAEFINMGTAGHTLEGERADLHPYPQNHILRHYIALNQTHIRQKYIGRTFNPRDVARGWHANRRNLTADMLQLPEDGDCFFRIDSADSKEFRRDHPTKTHFWEWE